MNNNQSDFIRTVRKALGKTSGDVPPDLFGKRPKDAEGQLEKYKKNPDRDRLYDLFVEQAESVNIKVTRLNDISLAGPAIAGLIQNTTPEWGDEKSIMVWDHPLINNLNLEQVLASENVTIHKTTATDNPDETEREKIRKRLIRSYIGITSADYCVAQTATLMMRTRPNQPRATSLVPSIHVAVIKSSQIIENLKELYFRLKWDTAEQDIGLTNCMTLISGPSKTGDIELVMVNGAHGPRQLHVYVIFD